MTETEIVNDARKVAYLDGEIDAFEHCIDVVMGIIPKKGEVIFMTDRSLPNHSILCVITKESGRHHYTIGIIRHTYGDGRISWSASS